MVECSPTSRYRIGDISSVLGALSSVQILVGHRATDPGKAHMSTPEEIERFLADYPPEVREVALAARRMLVGALAGARETLDESAKVIGYSYGPGYKGVVCTLILSRTGVKVGIVRGSELSDPKQLMRGSGKVHRHVQLQTIADLKQPGLKSLLKAAFTAWRQRNRVSG
jgi:hypothetical protein